MRASGKPQAAPDSRVLRAFVQRGGTGGITGGPAWQRGPGLRPAE